ncbi:hypothetical protein P872_05900 [Rhodonellum psychrophilum GCM71 = DSM 17998]|uniref:6-bladed beta-propeller n=2 Tax=Rhodonellum TaxID=336827 RepID=U5C2Z1_9BACT|nr:MULTISPECIES: 6-bladed beta-propeller [Rhodonellum]ERM82557.1 hypothetical protein P872_05900 [Rhodonellum psychrophilum GCM71 = DSM 17998]
MKNLFKIYFFQIALLFCFSCGRNNAKSVKELGLVIDIQAEKEIFHSDMFDDYEIIPLETTYDGLVGEISQILLFKDLIFVLDRNLANALFIFSRKGNLLRKIESKGMGPGELFAPVNIAFNEADQELIVFDGRQAKFLFYDVEGNFLRENKKPELLSVFDMFFQKDYYYFIDDRVEDWHRRLLVTDRDLKEILRIDTFFDGDFRIINGKKNRYFYESHDGNGFYYKERNHNRLLAIEESKVIQQYLFSFSSLGFEPNSERVYQAHEFSREFWKSGEYALGDEMIDSKRYAFLSVDKGQEVRFALWDKEKGSVNMITNMKNDMDGISPDISGIPPLNAQSNHLIWAIHPRDLANYHRGKNLEDNPFLEFASKNGIDGDDNPILFIYTIKN